MKDNKNLIIIIIILGCLVLGLGGFIVYDKFISQDEVKDEVKDEVVYNKVESDVDNNTNNEEKMIVENVEKKDKYFYKESLYKTINYNKCKISFGYYLEDVDGYFIDDGIEVYNKVYVEVLVNDKVVEGSQRWIDNDTYNNIDYLIRQTNFFDTNDISIIKSDKEYILIMLGVASMTDTEYGPLVINENGDNLYSMITYGYHGWEHHSKNSIIKDSEKFAISESGFYYNIPNCSKGTPENAAYYLDEFFVTFIGDKSFENKIDEYTADGIQVKYCK